MVIAISTVKCYTKSISILCECEVFAKMSNKVRSVSFRQLACLVLSLALLLAFAGCNRNSGESSSQSQSPDFVNPLDDPELEPSSSVNTPDQDMLDKMVEAYNLNSDTIGWLRVPHTTIDNSVLQKAGETDNNYYLRLDEEKKSDNFGCYFADYENTFGARSDLTQNTIIYGHSDIGTSLEAPGKDNPNGKRFSQLFHFADMEFAKSNPYIYFSTFKDDMVWQIFSVMYTDIDFNYIYANYSDADFLAMVNDAKARSEYVYDVEVTADDKILTLSTCTVKYGTSNKKQRFVIMAKLLPAGAQLEETASLTKNENVKLPNFVK